MEISYNNKGFEPISTHGGVAQLGEHLPCKQGVRSSNLLVSTISIVRYYLTSE